MPVFKNLPVLNYGFYVAIIISSLFVIFLIFWYYISGVYFNLDLSKVYDLRVFNSNLSSKGIFAYTNGWTYNIFNMFLLSVALLKRKTILVILILCIQIYLANYNCLLNYSYLGFLKIKSVGFSLIMSIFTHIFSVFTPGRNNSSLILVTN